MLCHGTGETHRLSTDDTPPNTTVPGELDGAVVTGFWEVWKLDFVVSTLSCFSVGGEGATTMTYD